MPGERSPGDTLASAGGMRVRLGRGSISDIGAGARDAGMRAALQGEARA